MQEDFSNLKPRGLEPYIPKIKHFNIRMEKVSLYNIKETKEMVIALCSLSNVVVYSLEDGKIGLSDLPGLVLVFPKLVTGVAGINLIPQELADLDDSEKAEIVEAVKAELNMSDNVEAKVEQALNVLYQIKILVDLFK